ncbi:hypothetical protein [Hymenobacter sp. CRA2]|uniref:hypothetical protein n=1 Tax=Hymenobacter sp. CRA2 TaxID=1955620 RepID=UPI00098FD5D8|nr:hypothetical protein [Hymenobacter sp. CRA2]OON66844.1 hypothetical protein B0919_21015 [Hymenobacter sp. CRA2]
MNRNFWLLRGLRFLLAIVAFIALASFVVMALWNWLMPAIFGLPLLTFWQALGLLVLSKILFGGFRGGPPGGRAAWKAKAQEHWRNKMESRMQGMSEEEREKFRQKMRRCSPPWSRMPEPQVHPTQTAPTE